jgi:intracellular sulfur oxidation DsrE/DsrF family protein
MILMERTLEKTILITSEFLGRGDDELGGMLMGSFFRKLCTATSLPPEIIFYNAAVKLLAEGSSVLDAIEMLAQKGVDITAYGTCVNYYKLNKLIDPVQIGDMVGIIAELMASDSVVTV